MGNMAPDPGNLKLWWWQWFRCFGQMPTGVTGFSAPTPLTSGMNFFGS